MGMSRLLLSLCGLILLPGVLVADTYVYVSIAGQKKILVQRLEENTGNLIAWAK